MEKIENKIKELNEEAANLANISDHLNQQLKDIQIRITQIVGAVKALKEILNEDND